MRPGVYIPLLSSQGGVGAAGSETDGERFVPEPPAGCGWTSEGGRETRPLSMWEQQADWPQNQLEKVAVPSPLC